MNKIKFKEFWKKGIQYYLKNIDIELGHLSRKWYKSQLLSKMIIKKDQDLTLFSKDSNNLIQINLFKIELRQHLIITEEIPKMCLW